MVKYMKLRAVLFIGILLLLISNNGRALSDTEGEVVNRIAAVVNDEIITLGDLKIARAFYIYGGNQEFVLQKMVDQKLVIQLTEEDEFIEPEELEESLRALIHKLGSSEVNNRLQEFDIVWDDLREYFHEKILFQRIVSKRFSQSATVRLREIEDYYQNVYVPDRRKRGLEPEPMLEILDQIESAIKDQKTEKQVELWLEKLRQKAYIELRKIEENETGVTKN